MKPDNAKISIREITDAGQLKTIESLAWKIFPDTYRDLIPPEQTPYMMGLMYDQAVLRKEFSEGMKFALIYDAETPIGYISWHLKEEDGGKFMRLEKLYLDFAWHGRSIGNMGLRFVIEKAKQAGASYISLNVHKRNLRAQNAYCRVGFYRWRSEKEEVGHGFFKDDYIMRCDLASGKVKSSAE
jgi:ribosomal protein S18 acetylase RimI-like enzyme